MCHSCCAFFVCVVTASALFLFAVRRQTSALMLAALVCERISVRAAGVYRRSLRLMLSATPAMQAPMKDLLNIVLFGFFSFEVLILFIC